MYNADLETGLMTNAKTQVEENRDLVEAVHSKLLDNDLQSSAETFAASIDE